MRVWLRVGVCCVLAVIVVSASGCASSSVCTPWEHWGANRLYDLADIFILEGGVTMENPTTGMFVPSFGFFFEATPLITLGAITHHGYSAGMDHRGFGAYYEDRSRIGLGPFQAWWIDQNGAMNMFKTPGYVWHDRIYKDQNWEGASPKTLIRQDKEWQVNSCTSPYGWHYWQTVSAEVAVCEPFLLKSGGTLRAGFDISETLDFVLGFLMIDYKRDDLRDNDTDRKIPVAHAEGPAPAAK